ncbi:MAG: type II secretion system protein E [Candidatus Parvarchaeum acidophilus ARMAN-5]|jgi:flagellar protein FlaI|uniref:Type II secretion system protein E n=1 Tax=Candidatus Parvarchaeum acidophilus ARMAN-5 TaxID=662762 RepID=D6GX06_PARA5|nr:MAG: type II secretion system protein E [Candidatus Parvarchaeum acidophilus ARMAN-5]
MQSEAGEIRIVDSYDVVSDGVTAKVRILDIPSKFTMAYHLATPVIDQSMNAVLSEIRTELIKENPSKIQELSQTTSELLKRDFLDIVQKKLIKLIPGMPEKSYIELSATLLHEMFGLGIIEILDNDANLEEIVINDSKTYVKVYHVKYGWLETNVKIETESKIEAYSQQIARKVGRQITNLNPLLDAQLPNGDRVNATLYPISTHGNTLDIRKFRADPWTVIDFLERGTLSKELVSFVWQAMQYELSFLVTGGTASGKTSMLNVFLPFIPPNQRIITIEDTSELVLPKYMHWVPMLTRQKNAEGKGEVTMLDLLLNSLRMRPDRLVVGEIRKKEDAQTLFEAMMTGHSVYATMHAETAQQVVKRLVSEPIDLPEIEVATLDLIITAFRQRRTGVRRVLELAEIVERQISGVTELKTNNLFEWKPRSDKIERTINTSQKLSTKLALYSGLTSDEMADDLKEKVTVLQWMTDKKIKNVNTIGLTASNYYTNHDQLMQLIKDNGDPSQLEVI